MESIYDNELEQQTKKKKMVEGTISEFDSEMKTARMVKITEIWLLGLWLLEQKNRESRAAAHTHKIWKILIRHWNEIWCRINIKPKTTQTYIVHEHTIMLLILALCIKWSRVSAFYLCVNMY